MRYPQKLYWTILNNISDAVFLLDEKQNFYFICPNSHVIFGYSYKEFEKFDNLDFIFGEGFIDYDLLVKVEELKNIRKEIIDKYGNRHILLVNIKKVDIEKGKILITCRDISGMGINMNTSNTKVFDKYSDTSIDSIKKGEVYISYFQLSKILVNHLMKNYENIIFVQRHIHKDIKNSENISYIGMNNYDKKEYFSQKLTNDLMFNIRKLKKGIIYFQNTTYIYKLFGFDYLINLIFEFEKCLRDTDFSLIFEIDTNVNTHKEVLELSSYFCLINSNSIINISDIEKDILKYVGDSKDNINMNSISKRFKIARITARKYVNSMVDKGLIFLIRERRDKHLKLTRGGAYFYLNY